LRVNVGDFSWTRFDAFPASCTLLVVHCDGGGFLVNRQCLERARFDARVVFALGAEVRKFGAGNQHENADPRSFWPEFVLMTQGAGDFAFSATAASGEVTCNPDL